MTDAESRLREAAKQLDIVAEDDSLNPAQQRVSRHLSVIVEEVANSRERLQEVEKQ
jgi:hypothetical protein